MYKRRMALFMVTALALNQMAAVTRAEMLETITEEIYSTATESDAWELDGVLFDDVTMATLSQAFPAPEEEIQWESEEYTLQESGKASTSGLSMWSLYSDTDMWADRDSYRDQLEGIPMDDLTELYDVMEEHFGELNFDLGIEETYSVSVEHYKEEIAAKTEELSEVYKEKLQTAADAFCYDHPQMFWQSQMGYKFVTKAKTNYDFTGFDCVTRCQFFYTTDKTQEEIVDMLEAEEAAAESVTENTYGTFEFEQLQQLYQYICENAEYDYAMDGIYSHDAYGVLVDNMNAEGNSRHGKVVCEGYAKALKYLCDQLDIPCVLIIGEVGTEKPVAHMWNYIRMEDNRWYAVDTTWDDQGNSAGFRYFLIGNSFREQHIENHEFSEGGWNFDYPVLSEEDYPQQVNLTESFVRYLYQTILKREPDADGLKAWTTKIDQNNSTALTVAERFIRGREYTARYGKNEDAFLDILKKIAGFEHEGERLLKLGFSRSYVLQQAADRPTFENICVRYKVPKGSLELTENRDQDYDLTCKIAAYYEAIRGGSGDIAGLNFWTGKILEGEMSQEQVIYRFVFSSEVKEKELDDQAYVELLYRICLKRRSDRAGFENWMEALARGKTREYVLDRFLNSKEYMGKGRT